MTENLSMKSDYTINESYPFLQSHPAHLRTLAQLFGLKDAVEISKSKVLELGCGSGGNLIPMAYEYPNASFLGLDTSPEKVELANKQVKELGLKNIEFKVVAFNKIDESYNDFDYIIAHNIFSLVSEEEQDNILKLCKERLSKNGVSYIGYNTLPGENLVRSVRDMMKYHADGFKETTDKAMQARLLLDFIKDATKDTDTPYANILKSEADLLANYSNHKLSEELLNDQNTAFYFSEFMLKASKNKMQYLADANLPSMYVGNLSEDVSKRLAEIGDIIRTEQYMDFVVNRRFRATLLCHQDVKLKRDIGFEDIRDFHMSMYVAPEKAEKDVDLMDDKESLSFKVYSINGENALTTTSPIMKATLYSFAESISEFKIGDIATDASKKLKKISVEDIKQAFSVSAPELVLSGYLHITAEPKKFVLNISEKPKVSDIARMQAASPEMSWVTNMRHERYPLNPFEKYMIALLDGKNTKDQVVKAMVEYVTKGELQLLTGDDVITDEKVIAEQVKASYDQVVAKLAPSALFVA